MWASQTKGWKKYTREELMENHLKIVKELIAAGADVNHKTEVKCVVAIVAIPHS